MRIIESPADWRRERDTQTREGLTLGFVPTMGALHRGHLTLVHRSLAENHCTLVSIFVNPTQFNDSNDLARYPRTLDADLAMLRAAGVDAVFVPTQQDMYGDGYRYRITEREASLILEGAHRPGHFDGVLTVVMKLLLIASADRAYFGEKDWQQLMLVRGMAAAFFVPTEIVACPTEREADGLALSSRNQHLSPASRALAPHLYRVLTSTRTAGEAVQALERAGLVVDYVEERDGRRLGAVRLDHVRLIDNVPLEGPQ